MNNPLNEFKEFLSKGNVVDLAVAVVIGGAINTTVTALVTDVITPAIGVPGHVNFAGLTFAINGSTFLPGLFLNAIINFIVIAVVVFFFIVKPMDNMKKRSSAKHPAGATTKICPECLSVIPIKATRCAFCTSKLKA